MRAHLGTVAASGRSSLCHRPSLGVAIASIFILTASLPFAHAQGNLSDVQRNDVKARLAEGATKRCVLLLVFPGRERRS